MTVTTGIGANLTC